MTRGATKRTIAPAATIPYIMAPLWLVVRSPKVKHRHLATFFVVVQARTRKAALEDMAVWGNTNFDPSPNYKQLTCLPLALGEAFRT